MGNGVLGKIRGLATLRISLHMVWESARSWTIAAMALMVIQGVLPLLTLYFIKLTVDEVASSLQTPDKSESFYQALFWIFLTGATSLMTAGCSTLSTIVREHQSQRVTDHVMDVIHRQSAAVDLGHYENADYHDVLFRAQQEGPFRPTRIVQSLTELFQNGLSLLGLAVLLFYLHWMVALVMFLAVLPSIVVKVRHADRLFAWQSRRAKTERQVYEYHQMLTDSTHAKELRLFDLGGVFRERYRRLRRVLNGERLRLAITRALFDLTAQAGALLSLVGMLGFIAWTTIQGSMTLGDMVMYYQAFQRAQSALQQIVGGLSGLYEDSLFLSHFRRFMEISPTVEEPLHPLPVPRPMRRGIEIEHLSFRYPSAESFVLKEICLTIGPGEVVALVGDNGSGKTTLAKLLCRFYDPTSGSIRVDGVDFRDYDLQGLRREITMIFQDYIHYALSARENIWFGDVTLDPDDDRIRQAAQKAGADRLIRSLPDGYDTILSNRFEEGVELSIGEWQKVALARAFLRDAQLIILDEPTSAMSVQAEYEVFQAIRALLHDRAALLISHRFSTVRMADKICVLENGRIVEEGSHHRLMSHRGRYARLYEMQAASYSTEESGNSLV